MTERTEQRTSSGSNPSPAPGAPARGQLPASVDIEKIADMVYRMMLRDLVLARERGVGRR